MKRDKDSSLRYLAIWMVVTFLFLFLAVPPRVWSAGYITGSGCSISDVGYLGELAREYERRTGRKVFVRGGGSVVGIEDLMHGRVDFAASCRGRTPHTPKDIRFIPVAWDALVFIVNKTNPVDNVTLGELRSIYAGKITNWRKLGGRGGPIELFVSRSREGLSGVETSVRNLVLQGKTVRSPDVRFVPSSGIVEQLVENRPDGFAATGFSSARRRKVKILKVNGIYPTVKSIVEGSYRFKRRLFLLVPSKPKPGVMKFINFVLSDEGQHFISSQGMVSLRDIR